MNSKNRVFVLSKTYKGVVFLVFGTPVSLHEMFSNVLNEFERFHERFHRLKPLNDSSSYEELKKKNN